MRSEIAERRTFGEAESAILDRADGRAARAEIRGWPGYEPTPLLELDDLAERAGLGTIRYKDESGRFGLGSFKATGGAYAVYRTLARELGRRSGGAEPRSVELLAGRRDELQRRVASGLTVTCATAGNHGRSVAWGAELFGCRCVVFLPADASPARAAAIEGHGARVVRTDSHYDEAVERAQRTADERGWHVVSDTSYAGYEKVPRDVMHGYTVMVAEAVAQLEGSAPLSHVFVQAGVGGLSTAVCGHLWQEYGTERPAFVLVEPQDAAPFCASVMAGERREVAGPFGTMMGGLASGQPSLLAWRLLASCVDACLTISDETSAAAMRLLAARDPAVTAGESGAAGLGGLLAAASNEASRVALGLDSEASVLVFGTEGALDPERYAELVGAGPRGSGGGAASL